MLLTHIKIKHKNVNIFGKILFKKHYIILILALKYIFLLDIDYKKILEEQYLEE